MKQKTYLLLGCLLLLIGSWLLYENGGQLVKGHSQPYYEQPVQIAATPVAHPAPVLLPKLGEVFGTLTIPALRITLPIYEGTRQQDLKQGVGHYVKSVLPGQSDNCVLSGHNDSVFRRLDELAIGDELLIQTDAGHLTYRVTKTWITEKNDRRVIVPTKEPTLTITTCYPFRYIGRTSQRYVIRALLVKQS